mgnify:CR=1 FL=1
MRGEILKRYVRRTSLLEDRNYLRQPGESYEDSWFRNFGIPVQLVVATEYDYDTQSDVIYYRYPISLSGGG